MRFNNWLEADSYISGFNNSQVALHHNKFSDWSQDEKSAVLNSMLASDLPVGEFTQLNLVGNGLAAPKSTSLTSALTATTCKADQYVSGTSCLPCPSGCSACISKAVCTACWTSNFVLSTTTKLCSCSNGPINAAGTDCIPCTSGNFYNTATKACNSCGITNCTSCNSTTYCSLCANGYQFISGKCVCNGGLNATGYCTPCASNEYYKAAGCTACPGNCTSCTAPWGTCTACAASFTLTSGKCSCASG